MKRDLVKKVVSLREKLFAKKCFQEAENPTKELEGLLRDWSEFGEVEDTEEFLDEVRILVPQVTGRPLDRSFKRLLNDWSEFGEVEDTDEFIEQIIKAVKRAGGPVLKLDYL
ncbi:MAG: hypothetical protein LBB98_04045 [Treponema sp.]|jgi:hypothetical protein|nr:hypothetical protein [Treponema sp.]